MMVGWSPTETAHKGCRRKPNHKPTGSGSSAGESEDEMTAVISRLSKGVHYVDHHRVEGIGRSCNDKTKYMVIINDTIHELKMYFRHERTWDDHMGNTPCGYYVVLPLPNGSTKRAYLF